MIEITAYRSPYLSQVIELILSIQQKEFNIPVTIEAQPDLQQIPRVYQTGNGNFWVALYDEQVIGTIGLIDIGENIGVIRKMFVRAEFRGKEHKTAYRLLQTLLQWSVEHKLKSLYLGTVERLTASHRFYERNGFKRIEEDELPKQFPRMKVDTIFYHYDLK